MNAASRIFATARSSSLGGQRTAGGDAHHVRARRSNRTTPKTASTTTSVSTTALRSATVTQPHPPFGGAARRLRCGGRDARTRASPRNGAAFCWPVIAGSRWWHSVAAARADFQSRDCRDREGGVASRCSQRPAHGSHGRSIEQRRRRSPTPRARPSRADDQRLVAGRVGQRGGRARDGSRLDVPCRGKGRRGPAATDAAGHHGLSPGRPRTAHPAAGSGPEPRPRLRRARVCSSR